MSVSTKNTTIGDSITCGIPLLSPTDSTTYYFGAANALAANTVDGDFDIAFPRNGIVKTVTISIYNSGTLGSAETSTMYFRLNSTTDSVLTTTITTNSDTQHFVAQNLNIVVTQGDRAGIKWVTPAYVTNPTSLRGNILIYWE